MKVQNTTIFMGDETLRARHGYEDAGEKQDKKNIFAGGLNKAVDPILQKKREAQQKAMKIVGDAWAGERKIDDDLDARRAKIEQCRDRIGKAKDELKEIENSRIQLRERYEVEADSKEEQDLKLLEKEMDSQKPGSDIHLTEEEYKQLEEIKAAGLSEYQQRSLDLKKGGEFYEDELTQATEEMLMENSVIRATELERLKSQSIMKAEKAADEIMEAASDQIIGMLIDESKDHIDEEMEEKKEAAEEAEEKKEEEEEKIEKREEKKDEEEQFREQIKASTELMVSSEDVMDDVQREIKKIMDEMKLLEEDMKGAAVDTVS